MSLDISGFEDKAKNAVKTFWGTRDAAKAKQEDIGKADQGERSGVTAGKNLDGFIGLFTDVITANGVEESSIHLKRKVLTLPGYFRPTKMWDMLVVQNSELVAAIELKSQVGPSFGNNFNNRTEEALGTAIDLDTAYREGAFGQQPSPFVGWLMLLEDTDASRSPVSNAAPHFSVFPEFDGASYAKRYHLLCRKMMQEKHYTSAALMLTKREQAASGEYSEVDSMTGLKTFLSELAGHVAAAAARHSN